MPYRGLTKLNLSDNLLKILPLSIRLMTQAMLLCLNSAIFPGLI